MMPWRAVPVLLAALLPPAAPAARNALAEVPAAVACALGLSVLDPRAGTVLARVPLDPARPAFSTAYRHSVTGATVVDDYRVEDGRIVLVRERFAGAGYGLAHGPSAPGERLTVAPDGTAELILRRPLDRLVIRVSGTAANRLTEPVRLDLAQWGDGPRELAVHAADDACADPRNDPP